MPPRVYCTYPKKEERLGSRGICLRSRIGRVTQSAYVYPASVSSFFPCAPWAGRRKNAEGRKNIRRGKKKKTAKFFLHSPCLLPVGGKTCGLVGGKGKCIILPPQKPAEILVGIFWEVLSGGWGFEGRGIFGGQSS